MKGGGDLMGWEGQKVDPGVPSPALISDFSAPNW